MEGRYRCGHLRTRENTYTSSAGYGQCLRCKRLKDKERYERRIAVKVFGSCLLQDRWKGII